MKILIAADMEGIDGVTGEGQVDPNGLSGGIYNQLRKKSLPCLN